jgi:hypothetical protein
VITRELAAELRDAGLAWTPAKGDRFMVPDRDMDELEFVVSDMVIETRWAESDQQVLAFNGTTEWALDMLAASEALWLPREGQLREVLGEAFVGLQYLPGETPGYAVSVLVGDTEERFVDIEVESAYARAVLALLASVD